MEKDIDSTDIGFSPLLQKILKVPTNVSETGYIKIVAVNSLGPHTQGGFKWEYKARNFDPLFPNAFGSMFDVSEKEINSWLKDKANVSSTEKG